MRFFNIFIITLLLSCTLFAQDPDDMKYSAEELGYSKEELEFHIEKAIRKKKTGNVLIGVGNGLAIASLFACLLAYSLTLCNCGGSAWTNDKKVTQRFGRLIRLTNDPVSK